MSHHYYYFFILVVLCGGVSTSPILEENFGVFIPIFPVKGIFGK